MMNPQKSFLRLAAGGLARFFLRHPRLLIAGIVAYVILPVDLVPEAFFGPVGYLDDLIIMILPLLLRGYARKLAGVPEPDEQARPKDYFDTTAR